MSPRRDARRSFGPDDWVPYDHPPPIPVEGGLRARSRRGDIGETWWSRRFVAALERAYGTTASRLSRGRAYARAGQVVRLDLRPGIVEATVQGSRPQPYAVSIRVKVLSDAEWARVEGALATRALFLARLLAGEMPIDIEEAFEAAQLSLFPVRRGDLQTSCSCPDTANPCKHVAAAYYLLAESFDGEPFLAFAWRGRPRERLIADLRALRPTPEATSRPIAAPGAAAALDSSPGGADEVARFWEGGPAWAQVRIEPRPAGSADALVREMPDELRAALGDDVALLREVYVAAAREARLRLDPAAPVDTRPVSGRRSARSGSTRCSR